MGSSTQLSKHNLAITTQLHEQEAPQEQPWCMRHTLHVRSSQEVIFFFGQTPPPINMSCHKLGLLGTSTIRRDCTFSSPRKPWNTTDFKPQVFSQRRFGTGCHKWFALLETACAGCCGQNNHTGWMQMNLLFPSQV